MIVKFYDGTKWKNEKSELHRIDGPAIEYLDGTNLWFQNGRYHRIDGPAIVSLTPYTHYYDAWFVRGKEYPNKEEWFKALTKDEQVAYLFKLNR